MVATLELGSSLPISATSSVCEDQASYLNVLFQFMNYGCFAELAWGSKKIAILTAWQDKQKPFLLDCQEPCILCLVMELSLCQKLPQSFWPGMV